MERKPRKPFYSQESDSSEQDSSYNSEFTPKTYQKPFYSTDQGNDEQSPQDTNEGSSTYYKKSYNQQGSYNRSSYDNQQGGGGYYKKPYNQGGGYNNNNQGGYNQQNNSSYYKKPYNQNNYGDQESYGNQGGSGYNNQGGGGYNQQGGGGYNKGGYNNNRGGGYGNQGGGGYNQQGGGGYNKGGYNNNNRGGGYGNQGGGGYNQQGGGGYNKGGYNNNNRGGGYGNQGGYGGGGNQGYNKGGYNNNNRGGGYGNQGGYGGGGNQGYNKGGYNNNRPRQQYNQFEQPFDQVQPVYTTEPVLPNEREEAEGMRINKYIAHAGVCARRKADDFIRSGRVSINDEVMDQVGYRVKKSDVVSVDGKEIKPAKKYVYILLNKPRNVITTSEDEKGRKTVLDLVSDYTEERVYPVGRLDRDTTGLVLLTNDGELAQRLAHPSHNVKKIYQVTLDRPLEAEDIEKIRATVELADGPAPVDKVEYITDAPPNVIGMEIHIGKNRIVRRIFEHLNYRVMKLDRVKYAMLTKKGLSRGKCRFLTQKEITMLKYLF